jgi:hypothetical protein
MATLDALARQPNIQDYAQSSQFRLTLVNFPLVEWFCTSVTLPGVTLGVSEMETPFTMSPLVGDKMTFDNFDVTILVDEELKNYQEVYEWMVNIGFPHNQSQFMAKPSLDGVPKVGDRNLYSDLILTILSSKNNPKVVVTLYDAFPISLSGLTYTTQDTDSVYLTADVSFAYTWYDFAAL